jgi:DNA-binding LacI/PurR family transcriptional regulator
MKEKDKSLVTVVAGFHEEDGYVSVGKLLKKGKVDVIIAINDAVAMGAMRYLKKERIRIPDEIALVGFSDLKAMDMLEVPLTTVREPVLEIGNSAIEILMKEIANPSRPKEKIILEPKLIIRESA